MGEIECLACGKAIKPQQLNDTDTYHTENYDGQLRCSKCKALLHVKLVKGKVLKYKIVERLIREKPVTNITVRDEKSKKLLEEIAEGIAPHKEVISGEGTEGSS